MVCASTRIEGQCYSTLITLDSVFHVQCRILANQERASRAGGWELGNLRGCRRRTGRAMSDGWESCSEKCAGGRCFISVSLLTMNDVQEGNIDDNSDLKDVSAFGVCRCPPLLLPLTSLYKPGTARITSCR
ncbi:hypothetical protein E2C01_007022 [Portunus trituberculatus]|uniref:Uncharacterized protein n=1 Tax=Portunus trituberculatus TaxID=210409 RepID=A0A5B7CY21_PORTR|nr:hypothetical protein [Portunus trituberculatus]